MRYLAVAVLLSGLWLASQNPSPSPTGRGKQEQGKSGQPDQSSDNHKCGTKESPCVVEVLPAKTGDIKTEAQAKHEDDKAFNEKLIAYSTVALAIITLGLAVYTGLLWSTTKGLAKDAKEASSAATEIAREAAEAAKSNAKAAEANAASARDAAEAANKNADFSKLNAEATKEAAQAANKNIEMFISKERARLIVEMHPFDATPSILGSGVLKFAVNIHGSTAAYITETKCASYHFPLDVVCEPETGDMIMFALDGLPSVIAPNTPPLEQHVYWSFGYTDGIRSEIQNGRLFVGLRGFIKYKDVFDRERETTFRYVWKFDTLGGHPMEYGRWEKCGTPEENKNT